MMVSKAREVETIADVVVIGGGLAGIAAATQFGRAGRSVVVIDTHAVYPAEFRAEKLGDPHRIMFERLGLWDTVRPICTPVDRIDSYRFGHLFSTEHRREYGFAYADLINALRAAVPASVTMAFGRIAETRASDDEQTVTLADGRRYTGRLLVIATGHGDAVRRSVGIERVEIRKALSLSLGFDLSGAPASFPCQSVTAFGHRRADRVSYLTLFPIGATMRANLFVYREPGEAWTRTFRTDPQAALRALLPELEAAFRGFEVSGTVDVRPINIVETRHHRRSGVVLLGDAFATVCPITGYGMRRVLTDVEQMVAHARHWLETPGMGADKIASFYDDPIKQAMDAQSRRASLYARAMVVEDGPAWTFRRIRNGVVRRGLSRAQRLLRAAPRGDDRPDVRHGSGRSFDRGGETATL